MHRITLILPIPLTHAKSVEGLSKERPQPNIFNLYIIGSVLGQFAIHVITLIYLSNYVYQIEPYVTTLHFDVDRANVRIQTFGGD